MTCLALLSTINQATVADIVGSQLFMALPSFVGSNWSNIFGTCLESKPTPKSQLNHPMLRNRLSIGPMLIPQWISEKSQHPHGKSRNIDVQPFLWPIAKATKNVAILHPAHFFCFLKGRSQAMHSAWGLSRGDMLLIRSRLVVDSPQCLKWRKKGKIG